MSLGYRPNMQSYSLITILGLASATLVAGQQFKWYSYPWETLNLTQACFTAINSSVSSCPSLLATHTTGTGTVDILGEDALQSLCVDSCRKELQALRGTVQAACTGQGDVMVYDNIAYPATFMIDNLLYTYDVSCYKDSSSGKYCDLILGEWRNQTNATNDDSAAHDCSDCILGPFKIQLESPIGYDDEWAEDFTSLTSSCGATGYTYVAPTGYALNSSITSSGTATSTGTGSDAATPTSTHTCATTYTVQANDTCHSIAKKHSVSTYNLMVANGITIFCSNLAAPGGSICIPESCNSTTLLAGNSCAQMMSDWNVSMAQILAWNPIISSLCDNFHLFYGWEICRGPPGGAIEVPTGAPTTTSGPTATGVVYSTPAPVPTNAMAGSNHRCGKWYTTKYNDSCTDIAANAGIPYEEWLFLNPDVFANCTNLWDGYAYCVGAVGNVATYSGWTVTAAPTTSFTRPASTTETWTPGPTYILPHAPGTLQDCAVYRDAIDANNNPTKEWGLSTDFLDGLGINYTACSFYSHPYSVTVDDFVQWNPSLDVSDCVVHKGYSYCVLISYNHTSSDPPDDMPVETKCDTVDEAWIMKGTASDCNCYYVIRGKEAEGFECSSITEGSDLSEAKLVELNPWIRTGDCSTGLFAGLKGEEQRAVCLGTGPLSSSTTTSPTRATSPVTPTIGTSTSLAPSATVTPQPGAIKTCNAYHVVKSGDECATIAEAHGISLETFYKWNPQVGSDCRTLWLGYGVCVGVSS
ncbi:hypothetical protein AFLA70_31g004611 [Aspergillus flavus AF70]|nr:hypothetical protein AFLA70_31g004611 [Aspergillus flavus AF70]